MPRYIDADKLIDLATHEGAYGYVDVHDIRNTPTADVVERKKGKWIGKPIAGYTTVRCSVCNNVFRENNGRWSFCPDCGADMREEKEDE